MGGDRLFPITTLPKINLDHLHLLTDDVGLIQHAYFSIPDRNYGYSSDDVGRALAVLVLIYEKEQRKDIYPLINTYLSFLKHAQTKDGHFHNFMGYNRIFLDNEGSEDTLGRVIYGLGHAVFHGPTEKMRLMAQQMVEKSLDLLDNLQFPRAKAYAICGLYATRTWYRDNESSFGLILTKLADELVNLYENNHKKGWAWFEEKVTYGNANISEALLLAYQVTKDPKYRKVGLETLKFLTDCQWNGEFFDLIGNQGWYTYGGKKAVFGQQPIDAGYLTKAYITAYNVTGDNIYLDLAKYAFEWFFGRNRLKIPLYEHDFGAVADGLDSCGVNVNCGAESIVCFLLALLSLQGVIAKK